jgi:transposase
MGRPAMPVTTLHEHSIKELIEIKNTHSSEYARTLLTIVIMRYNGKTPKEIMDFTGKSRTTLQNHIKKWNKLGLVSIVDNRGKESNSRFTAEMQYDLIDVVNNKKLCDFGFVAHTWTCSLLSQYIYNNYGQKFCLTTIRDVLKRNSLSFKRAQPKPTKADKAEQERFKKNVSDTRYFRVFR